MQWIYCPGALYCFPLGGTTPAEWERQYLRELPKHIRVEFEMQEAEPISLLLVHNRFASWEIDHPGAILVKFCKIL